MNALMINLAEQRSRPAPPATVALQAVSIRRLGGADSEELDRLAGLDSSERPAGEVLGAELEGRLIAAVSIATGDAVADPFTRTAEVRSLLQLRASQVRESRNRGVHGGASRRNGLRGLTVHPRRGRSSA